MSPESRPVSVSISGVQLETNRQTEAVVNYFNDFFDGFLRDNNEYVRQSPNNSQFLSGKIPDRETYAIFFNDFCQVKDSNSMLSDRVDREAYVQKQTDADGEAAYGGFGFILDNLGRVFNYIREESLYSTFQKGRLATVQDLKRYTQFLEDSADIIWTPNPDKQTA